MFTSALLIILLSVSSRTVIGFRVRADLGGGLEVPVDPRDGKVTPQDPASSSHPTLKLEPDPACKWTREPDPNFAEDDAAKRYCEATVLAGADFYSLMDAPLKDTLVKNRAVSNIMPKWKVEYEQFDGGGTSEHIATEFDGKLWWWWPSNLPSEASQDRVLFLHGCHSDCVVQADYYSTLTSRLAHHMQMPVLGQNFAAEPEHPWPNNVKSVVLALDYISKHDPFGESPLRSLLIVGDSEGGLVVMHTMIALLDKSLSVLLGISAALRPPMLPIAGVVVISPTVNIQCTEESILTNNWGDQGPGTGNISTFSPFQSPMPIADRTDDCRWSYVNYFFGLPAGGNVRRNEDAKRAYFSHPVEFWTSPLTNPLFFDYATFGTPPILVITGAADYFASSGIDLAERICSCGARIEHFLAAGMWHDFPEHSEGCGNPSGVPLAAGIEAYRRIGSFAKRNKNGASNTVY